MSKKQNKSEPAIEALKSESARQRWELFHRAIAHAKESNNSSLTEADIHSSDIDRGGPFLTIIR